MGEERFDNGDVQALAGRGDEGATLEEPRSRERLGVSALHITLRDVDQLVPVIHEAVSLAETGLRAGEHLRGEDHGHNESPKVLVGVEPASDSFRGEEVPGEMGIPYLLLEDGAS